MTLISITVPFIVTMIVLKVESVPLVLIVTFPRSIPVWNFGNCPGTFRQYFGLGSEVRGTETWIPDPYGIEVKIPSSFQNGYQEIWALNIHAIDTRGVDDRLGCTDCECSLYNVTKDEHGRFLRKDYVGGLYCCYDKTHCPVREGFEGINRKLYIRYTVKWMDWDESIVPVRIYILDVTDMANRLNGSTDRNVTEMLAPAARLNMMLSLVVWK